LYESRKDFFKSIKSKEWYRTEGFNEIAFDFCKDISYRSIAANNRKTVPHLKSETKSPGKAYL
jgi:hypothetical protein